MKENLQEYTLIAKMMGGVAVIVTLIFLVVETRETAEMNVRVAQEGIESLGAIELYQYMTKRMALWGVYENAYFARQRGVLGDSEWSRLYGQICRNFMIESEVWEGITARGGVAHSLTPEFRLYTEISCQ